MTIDAYLTDSVTLVSPGATDGLGRHTAASVESIVSARVEWKRQLVRNAAGELVQASGSVLLSTRPSDGAKLRIANVEYPVLAVRDRKAWSMSHFEVYVG